MRLNKLLANRLGMSRRKADEYIANGRVTVSGQCAKVGEVVSDASLVKFDSTNLPDAPETCLVMINKPAGYICSRKGQGGKTIYDLLPKKYHHLNPIGRLDKDSSGLLLLTNDGALHNELTHPSFGKSKLYKVTLNKPLVVYDLKKIETGVQLEDGLSKFNIEQNNDYLLVSMREGRNRQIRRTFGALGYRVKYLHRLEFGHYKLGNLENSRHIRLIPKKS